MSDLAIEVSDLHKSYGDVEAVRGLSFSVQRGEVFGLLGPNGAGKTTTVEILEGFRKRSSGDVAVLGHDPGKRDARVRELSGGQRRRLDLALALVGDPELVFLDEPTTGFDPVSRRAAWRMIQDLRTLGKTVLLTTHYLDEAEHLADRVGVMARGRLVAVGPPSSLGGRATAEATVRFRADGPLAGAALPPVPALDVQRAGGTVTVRTTTPTAVVAALSAWSAAAGVDELPELCVLRPTLEDVYLRLVGADAEAAPT